MLNSEILPIIWENKLKKWTELNWTEQKWVHAKLALKCGHTLVLTYGHCCIYKALNFQYVKDLPPHFVSWNSLNNISPLFDDILEWSELHTANSSILACVTNGVIGVGQETSNTK